MSSFAETVIVVLPTIPAIASDAGEPGHAWPPPVTRSSSTSAPGGHGNLIVVTSLVSGVAFGVVPQPLRSAQSAVICGIDGPFARTAAPPEPPIVPLPFGAGSVSAFGPSPPV